MADIDNLLSEVSLICKKYEEIARITGENFNMFQTLGLQYTEWSHSKIIAELLNPKASHCMGDEFLKLFLNEIVEIGKTQKLDDSEIQKNRECRCQKLKDYIQNYELKSTKVEIEKTAKFGRPDIVISGDQAIVVIENKIYAEDQEKQLVRYRDSFCEKATIVYLTLDGREPSTDSTGEDKNTYDILMSYKDIIKLLEQYKEKSVNFPYLRETLAQYINLLKILTGQTRRNDMSDEIVITSVLKSPDNVKAAFALIAEADTIKRQIVFKYFVPAMEKLATEHSLTFDYSKERDFIKQPLWGISLSNPLLENNHIYIRFQFEDRNLQNFRYGFHASKPNENEILRNYLKKEIRFGKSHAWWPLYNELVPYSNLYREQLADLIQEESEIVKECKKKIVELLNIIEDFEKKQKSTTDQTCKLNSN